MCVHMLVYMCAQHTHTPSGHPHQWLHLQEDPQAALCPQHSSRVLGCLGSLSLERSAKGWLVLELEVKPPQPRQCHLLPARRGLGPAWAEEGHWVAAGGPGGTLSLGTVPRSDCGHPQFHDPSPRPPPLLRHPPGDTDPGAPTAPGPSLGFAVHAHPSVQTPDGFLCGHNCLGPRLWGRWRPVVSHL